VVLEPGEYEDASGSDRGKLRTPPLMTVEAVEDFGRWVFRFGGTRRDWVTAVRRVEAKAEAATWCPAHQCALPCRWCANSTVELVAEPEKVEPVAQQGLPRPNHYGVEPVTAEPFPAGTPEAMRDAKLRNHIFNCVTGAKAATWHYLEALKIITGYRLELTAERDAALAKLAQLTERYDMIVVASDGK
jgi:hypothetical protein